MQVRSKRSLSPLSFITVSGDDATLKKPIGKQEYFTGT